MLVGPRLAGETGTIESLRLRSYDVHTARTQDRALELLETMSPELVLADMEMGRSDGLEIIPALRRAPGIEEIPVVLVDAQGRGARRDAARRIGAAGYVVHPVDVARIAKRIAKMIEEPRRRRFTRFAQRLSARIEGRRDPLLVTSLGRGGMFVACDEDWPAHSFRTCRVSLPELGAQISVEAEVLYRIGGRGADHRGHGVRFHHFSDGGESTLIEYVTALAQSGPAPV